MDTAVELLSVPVGLAVGLAMVPLVNRYLSALADDGVRATPLGRIALPLTTAAAFTAGALEYGATWSLLPLAVGFAALAAVSWADLRAYRIPDRIVFPALLATLGAATVVDLVESPSGSVGRAAAGGAIFCGGLLAVHLVSPAGMGFGDVKLALLMGALIGWVADDVWELLRGILTALLVASLLGVVLGLGLAGVRRLSGRDLLPDPDAAADPDRLASTTFPFGPALAVGTVVATLIHHSATI